MSSEPPASSEPAPSEAEAPEPPPAARRAVDTPTRRRVLAWTGGVLGVGLLGGVGYALRQAYLRGFILRDAEGPPRDLPNFLVELPAGARRMTVVRGGSPTDRVARGLAAMGGMERFVRPGDRVVVKPNIGFDTGRYSAATTEPEVVAAVVRACISAGAKEVIVTDGPTRNIDSAYDQSGIRPAAAQAGARVVSPADADFVNGKLPGWGRWPVLAPYAQADKLINIPVVKHHSLAGTTIGMKAWYGALGGIRFQLHKRMDEAVAGLAQMFRPTLTVVDATRILMRNGPRGGNLADVRDEHALAISDDPVALDAWGSELLGVDLDKLGWLALAEQRGLGSRKYADLSPEQIAI